MSRRTVAEVEALISHAKLDPSDLLPLSQTLSFDSELLDQSRIHLLEVEPALADEILSTDARVVFRGDADDALVLCTPDKTYDVKEAETSNSLIFLQYLDYPADISTTTDSERRLVERRVRGIFHHYLELKLCKPRLNKLRAILAQRPYTINSKFDESPSDATTLPRLLDTVQCSEGELIDALRDVQACCIGGRWYFLETEYKMKVLSHILHHIAGESWALDSVRRRETLASLAGIEPDEVISQVFDMFHAPAAAAADGDQSPASGQAANQAPPTAASADERAISSDTFSVRRDALARFYGEYLLQTGTTFNLDEFVSMWAASLPEGFGAAPELNCLRGLAVVDETRTPKTIRSFPESSLPEDVHERLATLFKIRPRWTLDDVTPYAEPLTTPQLNVNALMTKFARPINVNGVKHFCAKHGK